MLIPCNIRIISTTSQLPSLFAVYLCRDINDTVQYVGVAPLLELLTMRDAFSNSKFGEIFGVPHSPLDIECEALMTTELEARQEQRRLVTLHNPFCNLKGYYLASRHQSVMCNETGETFRTAADAARAHNVSHSALVNHLNFKPGHKSVKGRTYTRFVPNV